MKGDREKIPQLFFDPRNPIKQVVIIFSILYIYKSNVVYKNIFRKLPLGFGVFHKLKAMYIYLELWLSAFMITSQDQKYILTQYMYTLTKPHTPHMK